MIRARVRSPIALTISDMKPATTSPDTPTYSLPRRAALFLGIPTVFAVTAVLFYPDIPRVQRQQEHARPDILLVTFDTLRADHCSLNGYPRRTTPTLDTLAREGLRFDPAYAPMATTAPSHATIMTGLYPIGHGVLRNGFPLSEKVVTLAERLKKEGYTTGAFVSSFVLFHKFGFAQGFDFYEDDFTRSEATQPQEERWEGEDVPGRKPDRRADAVTDRAIAWLNEVRPARRVPIFIWVHYMDPHEPYAPPASFGDPLFGIAASSPGSLDEAIARYDTEIAFADAQFDRLLRAAQSKALRDGLLVVATADHGESFVEHGWRGHGTQVYEESLRVPLIMSWKGRLPADRRVAGPVALNDITPTLLSIIGAPPVDGANSGLDLRPTWADPPVLNPDRPIFFQRRLYDSDGRIEPIPLREMNGATFGRAVETRGQKYAVRVGDFKYLESPQEDVPRELYDLATDPGEHHNLADQRPDVAARLSRLIAEWRDDHRRAIGPPPAQPVSPQDQALLKALGYTEPEKP